MPRLIQDSPSRTKVMRPAAETGGKPLTKFGTQFNVRRAHVLHTAVCIVSRTLSRTGVILRVILGKKLRTI